MIDVKTHLQAVIPFMEPLLKERLNSMVFHFQHRLPLQLVKPDLSRYELLVQAVGNAQG